MFSSVVTSSVVVVFAVVVDDFFLSGKAYTQGAGGADIAIANGFPCFFKGDGEIAFLRKDQQQFSGGGVFDGS